MENYYYTVEKESYAEFKDRGSSFLGYAFPIENIDRFKKIYREIKDKNPKASHYCYAYRLGVEGINFRSSDAGEPSGSAGKPILNQIDSRQLTNVTVLVVRYFGGTLLGIPGLINAYKTTASLALQLTAIIKKPILEPCIFEYDYTQINDVMMVIKRFECVILENEAQLFCRMKIGIPRSNKDLCIAKLIETRVHLKL